MESKNNESEIIKEAEALVGIDDLADISNLLSLLFHSLNDINWIGFYFLKNNELVLGPFQGKPACVQIPLGKGVCGKAAREGKTLIIDDVNQFAGHIACDPASQSELVVPIWQNRQVVGLLDVDSPVQKRFSSKEKDFFEYIVKEVLKNIQWQKFLA